MLARSTTCDARCREKALVCCVSVRIRVVAGDRDGSRARGQTSLVTGSTSGIGYAIAAALLREGADVIVNGRSQDTVNAAIERLREATGKTPKGFAADMSTAEGTAAIHAAFPNVDILVNNVGGYGPQAFEQSTDEDWYRLIDLNVMSGVRLSRLYLPRMREANWGRIIFISSESAYHIPPDSIHYGMTKAAQIAVARGLAEATATTGITVNSVVPGPTRTQFADNFSRNKRRRVAIPRSRSGNSSTRSGRRR